MISPRAVLPRLGVLGYIFAALWLAGWRIAGAQDTTPPASPPTHRPRIGLVLSGGGARGAAHVGVLKVLEQLHIPIDAIAGTSMGAVVGGLYASGLSPREIESIMTSLNWQDAFSDRPPREALTFRRKLEDRNFLVKFPLGLRGSHIQLPKGLIEGQKLSQTLRRLTLPVARITNFDELPTPFRAVATDLETGDPVIMDSGDLTTAMRASLSAPGVFSPVERDGRLLVDGGLSENLPVDVARQMGVDVLIVVDVSAPLLKRDKLSSAPIISNQMLAILIQRNSREQLQRLSSSDIVIRPPLGDASTFDFGLVARMIATGVSGGQEAESKLAALSVSSEEFDRYVARRDEARQSPPRIDFVKVDADSARYANRLERVFKDVVGKPLDPDVVARHVTTVYGQGNLEALDYKVIQQDDRYGLSLDARRNSWGPNYVRFGLSLQDDFQGNSTYDAAARFVLSEITQPGGEWVWDLQVGQTSLISTEIYLPITDTSGFFFLPHVDTEAQNVDLLQGQTRLAEYRVRSFDYGLDFGRDFGNWGEIRTGFEHQSGSENVEIGAPNLPSDSFHTWEYFVRLSYDRLDDVNFPHRGQQATLEWRTERTGFPNESFDRLSFSYLAAHSFGRYTAVFSTAGGTTIDTPPGLLLSAQSLGPNGTGVTTPADLRLLFPLGGFLNLSGIKADSLAGPHFAIARTLLYKQIGRGGPGYLDIPTYLGMSLEMGNVWQQRGDASFANTHRDASLFLGLDTFLGPIYLAYGYDDKGSQAFYLFLGRTF
ncbi:MAG TPA: patatin-like phospholipase family protein [Steroidobacteraceae bacterium]